MIGTRYPPPRSDMASPGGSGRSESKATCPVQVRPACGKRRCCSSAKKPSLVYTRARRWHSAACCSGGSTDAPGWVATTTWITTLLNQRRCSMGCMDSPDHGPTRVLPPRAPACIRTPVQEPMNQVEVKRRPVGNHEEQEHEPDRVLAPLEPRHQPVRIGPHGEHQVAGADGDPARAGPEDVVPHLVAQEELRVVALERPIEPALLALAPEGVEEQVQGCRRTAPPPPG